MGIDIISYRAAIGNFYAVTHRRLSLRVFNINMSFQIYCAFYTFWLLGLLSYLKNDEFSLYRLILLIMCMDIHSNPGPSSTDINSLDIFHLNTRSIRNKIDYVQGLTESYHILCFSETHLDDNVDTISLNFEGYNEPIRKDRTHNGGGVMVYISSALRYVRRVDLENPNLETIWIEIKLKSYDLLLCCFYRSDFTISQSNFVTELQSSIEEALDYSPYVILTGDINIDFLNLMNVQLRDCLSLYSLNNVITEPTRINEQSSTLIDPCLVSDACIVLDSGTMAVSDIISDHRATYVSIKIDLKLSSSYFREVWDYKHADYERLNDLIEQCDWTALISSSLNIDEACKMFTSTFLNFCKTCIPVKTVLIRANDKPWFNSDLRYNIRIRDRLRKKYLKTYNNSDKLLFKRQRNKVNNMKTYAKENYISNISDTISNHDSNSKSFWQLMGRFMGKKCNSVIIPPLRSDNTNYAFSNEEKTNLLNDYFCGISSIDESNLALPNFDKRTNAVMPDIKILQSEVVDVLRILKVNKASGPDGISHRMLKNTSHTISVPLTKLFNLSLRLHVYPSLWKSANVMPLFKKGDKSEVGNYRPVSLISCVGKAFERIIFRHVYNHIAEHSLLYKYQSGFLPGHSTVHHLIEVVHQTCIALENYETSCHVFCDISKAFDRVWHKGLILKLENYGIIGNLLLWFKDYLSNRHQKVFINGVYSSEKPISAGVPQGSVLGPLLFLIYINDITDNLTGMARLFADDTSLSFSSTNLAVIERVVNNDLFTLKEWATKWLITFHPQKTEVMLISNIFNDYNLEIKFDTNVLKIVDAHKHLGVILSSNNKWTKHIDLIIDSASKSIGFLRKLKYKLSKDILNKLYLTYIRPLLEYASEVWDGCSITDSNRIEKVQLHAARIITGLPIFASLNSLYFETGWEKLDERRKSKKLALMYKIVNNEAPGYLNDLLPNTVNAASNYNLRNRLNFEIPFVRLCSYENSFFPSTLKLWNELPLNIRNCSSVSQFKANVRSPHLKPPNYLYVGERKYNILLTRLRHNCSSLNSDLFNVNIIQYSNCSCGALTENVNHFFFECPLYTQPRNSLLAQLIPNNIVTLDLLLNGNTLLDYDSNKNVILAVLHFIKSTRRFS